jgi:hypothetical protein
VSIQAISWVLEHSRAEHTDRLVLIAIANHVDKDGEGWVHVSRVLSEANCCLRTYKSAVQKLEELGELERDVNQARSAHLRAGRRPNHYRIVGMQELHPLKPAPGAEVAPPNDAEVAPPPPQTECKPCTPEPLVTTEPSIGANNTLVLMSAAPAAPTGDVERVFTEWRQATGHERSRLDEKRKRLIRRALAGYPLEDVLAAVRGWRNSPHHRGDNDRHTVYDSIELLLRDAEHIERFRDLEQRGPPAPAMTRSAHNLRAWVSRNGSE